MKQQINEDEMIIVINKFIRGCFPQKQMIKFFALKMKKQKGMPQTFLIGLIYSKLSTLKNNFLLYHDIKRKYLVNILIFEIS